MMKADEIDSSGPHIPIPEGDLFGLRRWAWLGHCGHQYQRVYYNDSVVALIILY